LHRVRSLVIEFPAFGQEQHLGALIFQFGRVGKTGLYGLNQVEPVQGSERLVPITGADVWWDRCLVGPACGTGVSPV